MSSDLNCCWQGLIAVPESRERETLSLLLRNRGLAVLEVPLVAILDAPDPVPIKAWLSRFIVDPPALLVLLTGEGLRRLLKRADEENVGEQFRRALAQVPTLCRGPKPEKVLRDQGLKAHYSATPATSAGVLALAQTLNLMEKRVALQLYGEEPNPLLVNGLTATGAAVDVVAPYVYASEEDEERVTEFIGKLARLEVAMVAFTSQSQYKRLLEVAAKRGLQAALQSGLAGTVLAAVGPVVKEQLEEAGFTVAVMPERQYFMKPLVTAIVRYLEQQGVVLA
ncbi:MAG: uroporphyrinogen-III synthase [Pseudomonadota bacterium]